MTCYANDEETERKIVSGLREIMGGRPCREDICDLIVDEATGYCIHTGFGIGHLPAHGKWEALHYESMELVLWYLQNYGLRRESKDELYNAFYWSSRQDYLQEYPGLKTEYDDWEKRFFEKRHWKWPQKVFNPDYKLQGELFEEVIKC